MAALRAPSVQMADSFIADVDRLRPTHGKIDDAVEGLSQLLRDIAYLPHVPIDSDAHPGIYGIAVDYPDSGAEGLGLFFATYHATDLDPNPMQNPLRKYTLLSLTLR